MLDETLLAEAVRLSGAKTYTDVVSAALEDLVRRIKARRMLEFAGTGLWEGNLGEMRRDAPARASGRRRRG